MGIGLSDRSNYVRVATGLMRGIAACSIGWREPIGGGSLSPFPVSVSRKGVLMSWREAERNMMTHHWTDP